MTRMFQDWMRAVAVGITSCSMGAWSLYGGASENAALLATINPGPLEIVAPSVAGPFSPTGAPISVSNVEQVDAFSFNVSGITINDLNGDGRGWRITAVPANLTFGSSVIPVGTIGGFRNPSDAEHTSILDPQTSVFTLGSGVQSFTIDFTVAYTVPAFAAAGTYNGVIGFSVIAE